jgi:hypothetical protein
MTSGWVFSPEMKVMLRPKTAFRRLAGSYASEGLFGALRRPLFFAFLCGCMVSLVASQRLTARHVSDGAASASLLLGCQIAALAAVSWRQRELSFLRVVDLFFIGYGPWSLWMLGFSAVWAFSSPMQAFRWAGLPTILTTATVVAVWSGYIDFCFFEQVLRRAPRQSAWDVFLFRGIAWSASIGIFGGGSLWPGFTRIFDR